MKKVLVVAGKMHQGGLETMIMNFFRQLDRERVMFDFLLNYDDPGCYDEEIRRLGGKIYIMPRLYPKNAIKYIREVNRFFRQHHGEYDIVHGHLTSAGAIYLTIARLHGVQTRAIHAHYTDTRGNHHALLEKLMLLPLRYCANYFFACSEKAGRFCYGKRILRRPSYKTIHNGILLDRFEFSPQVRERKRMELQIEPQSDVLLHVGRFERQKNHRKLLEIFSAYLKLCPRAVLLLVGDGALLEETEEYAAQLDVCHAVRFLGLRDDVSEIMQAADVFMMPSLYEGLPVAGVEAQAAGLPLVVADTITKELDITGNCVFLPLNASDEHWAQAVFQLKQIERKSYTNLMREKGYDIAESAKWLEQFYLSH